MAMNAHKLQVKVFLEPTTKPANEAVTVVFHSWIKHHKLDELLIDVANYAHVPRGPGIALIGDAADYFLEEGDGRRGLLYSRKRHAAPVGQRIGDAFHRALNACALLEGERSLQPLGLRFRTDEFLFRINDRLLAPSNDATFRGVRDELEATCTKLFGGAAFVMASVGTPKQLFSVRITTSTKVELQTLVKRLA